MAPAEKSAESKDSGKRQRQPKWAQVLTITVSCILTSLTSSGIIIVNRDRLLPPPAAVVAAVPDNTEATAKCTEALKLVEQLKSRLDPIEGRVTGVETRATVLETKVEAAAKSRQEEMQLRALVQEARAMWGPGPVRYNKGP